MQNDVTEKGFFGRYGGRFVPPALEADLVRLEDTFDACMAEPDFQALLARLQAQYIGRPTPLFYAENASRVLGGAQVYLKLEGLSHTGAHKINNALGQGLIARRLGKRKLIAETGAGQHGLATATIAAKLGMECDIYMGKRDVQRQRPNVYWMELLGARVVPVERGTETLTDAVDAAFEAWEKEHTTAHYLVGSALGPSPYPRMVREFQSVIGREVKVQTQQLLGGLPGTIIACVGGGSNAMGIFSAFLDDKDVRLIAVEGGGKGAGVGEHAVRLNGRGREGVFQGYRSLFLQDSRGAIAPTHSISAGLDYCGVGPQIAHLGETGRVEFTCSMDADAVAAVSFFARHEGVIPAMESAHALAAALKIVPGLPGDQTVVVNVSGRGDKDLFITAPRLGDKEKWKQFLQEECLRLNDASSTGGK